MFYDATHVAQQEQRGISEYNAWVESFAQGGQQQYPSASAAGAADGYTQAGSVPSVPYGQQQQMQGMPVAMDQSHPQYQYQQYVPETHDPYNQAYPQQPMNTTPDHPQRSLPRASQHGYTGPTQPNMSSMPNGASYPPQQQQQQQYFPAQDDYLYHAQPSQSPAQPQVQERPTVQTRTSTQTISSSESIPQQRFQFAEYRHPDQLVAPAPIPSYKGGTPTSEVSGFSSPVSLGPDQSPSYAQGTSRKQGGGSKQTQKQAAGAQDKSKKRLRPQRESDSDDDDDDGGSFTIMSMPPSSAHGGPTRL